MASILSKKIYWLRGSKMVWNVEKTNKKFLIFFELSRFIEKSLSVGLVTRKFFIGSGGPEWSKMWRKPLKNFRLFSRSRSNSVTLKMLPTNPQSRNAQKRSLKHFCKSDGFRVIPFCVWFLPSRTTLTHYMDHSESPDDLENGFKKSAIKFWMHKKVKNWVSSREKCMKNTKKAEKTSFFTFQGQGQI